MTRKEALKTAIDHLEHMAAWISKNNSGYSFEGVNEDMPSMRTALNDDTPTREEIIVAIGEVLQEHKAFKDAPFSAFVWATNIYERLVSERALRP